MNTPNSDHKLNQHDDSVKRAYHSAIHDEPRAIIDDAIRAAARRAVSSQPMSIKKTWLSRWTAPLAAAATVMLTSSVIFMAVRDRPEVAPSIADRVTAGDAVKIAPGEVANYVAPATPALESGVANKRAEAAAAATITTQQPVTPSPTKQIAPPVVLPAVPTTAPTVPLPVPLPKALPMAAPIAALAAPSTAAPTVLKEMKVEAASDVRTQDTSRKKQSDREATAALTAEVTGKVMPPPPAAANVADASSVAVAPPQTRMLATSQTTAAPRKPRAEMTPTAPPVAAEPAPALTLDTLDKSPTISPRTVTTAAEKSDKIESADAWIKRMSELKRLGKNKELADEITRFRKRYPNMELPKELTEAPN